MRYRHISLLAAAYLLVSWAALAQPSLERGDVIVQTVLPNWYIDPHFAGPVQVFVFDANGVEKPIFPTVKYAYNAPGPNDLPVVPSLIARTPDAFFGTAARRTGTGSDTRSDRFVAWRKGSNAFSEQVHGRTLVGELAPMRSGDFLAVSWKEGAPHEIVRFNSQFGIVSTHDLPPPADIRPLQYYGFPLPQYMELLADQCTLAWVMPSWWGEARLTKPNPPVDILRILGFNVCTNEQVPDLLALPANARFAGPFRQLPNGDFLIGTGDFRLHRYDGSGKEVAVYGYGWPTWTEEVEGITAIALTPDASGVWLGRNGFIERFDFAGSREVPAVRIMVPRQIRMIAVVGEWRAATNPVKRRVVAR